jgi:hypothetical protein
VYFFPFARKHQYLKKEKIVFSAFSLHFDISKNFRFSKKQKTEFLDHEASTLINHKEVKMNIKNVLLTPMPYLCLALPLSKHTGTHGVQNMLKNLT